MGLFTMNLPKRISFHQGPNIPRCHQRPPYRIRNKVDKTLNLFYPTHIFINLIHLGRGRKCAGADGIHNGIKTQLMSEIIRLEQCLCIFAFLEISLRI
jgi:hypothetical protein